MPHRSWAPWALVFMVLLAGCATGSDAVAPTAPVAQQDDEDDVAPAPPRAAPVPPPAPPAPPEPRRAVAEPAADPFGDVGFKEVNEKDWLANLRAKIAQQEKVEPTDLRVSPGLLRAAFVRTPAVVPNRPGRRPVPRHYEIIVVDNQGRRVAAFRPLMARGSDEPPKDLRFLAEERLVYEVVAPTPVTPAAAPAAPAKRAAARPASRGKKKTKGRREPPPAPVALAPAPPARTFAIQPIVPRARPIKCVGFHFTFSRERDHLAYVTGSAAATPPAIASAAIASAFVAVDGAQVYPRRGRTAVASPPAWSKDGRSLAFLEAPSAGPARLVMLAELDNPTGDTSWDLPPATTLDGVGVFWAGTGKLVVGKTAMRPVFSASFTKD